MMEIVSSEETGKKTKREMSKILDVEIIRATVTLTQTKVWLPFQLQPELSILAVENREKLMQGYARPWHKQIHHGI